MTAPFYIYSKNVTANGTFCKCFFVYAKMNREKRENVVIGHVMNIIHLENNEIFFFFQNQRRLTAIVTFLLFCRFLTIVFLFFLKCLNPSNSKLKLLWNSFA